MNKLISILIIIFIGIVINLFIYDFFIKDNKEKFSKTKHDTEIDKLTKSRDSLLRKFIITVYERGYDDGMDYMQDKTSSLKNKKWHKDSIDMIKSINNVID